MTSKRTIRIPLSLTPKEHEQLREMSSKELLTMSGLLRRKALYQEKKK